MNHIVNARFNIANRRHEIGVSDGARTHDNRNHNPGLYHLSYAHQRNRTTRGNHDLTIYSLPEPKTLPGFNRVARLSSLARPAGFEPATLGLEGRCSIRMSYGRLIRYPIQQTVGRGRGI